MFRNMNVPNLWTDRKGAIAVEFAVVSLLLISFIFFFADIVIRESTAGAMDRLSYSMAGVIRERTQLYNSDERINQTDVDQLYRLAQKALSDMHIDASQLEMSVQEMHFQSLDKMTHEIKQEDYVVRLSAHNVSGQCEPNHPIEYNHTVLAPMGSYQRIVPIVNVTVCLPTVSWFSRFISREEVPLVSSTALVMVR